MMIVGDIARMIVGAVGLLLCAWNLWTAMGDYRSMAHERSEVLSVVARSTVVRTVICLIAQVVLLASVIIEPSDRLDELWRFVIEIRSILIAVLVMMLSAHDRIARVLVRIAVDNEEGA